MIKQGTPEWLEARKNTIGASEIYSLVHHYCKDELSALGIDPSKEKPFLGAQELYLKLAGAELLPIDPVLADFGNCMEPYILMRCQEELAHKINFVETEDFLTKPEFHSLASCSPDGYVEIIGTAKIDDFDQVNQISSSCGKGVLELKTSNYFADFRGGAKVQYLFQLQYQIALAGAKWGMLAVISPTNPDFDDPYFKGQFVAISKTNPASLADKYNLFTFVYPILPRFQELIIKALNKFAADFEASNYLATRNNEDEAILARENKILAKLEPTKFGAILLSETDSLDELINQRQLAAADLKKAKTDMENFNAKIRLGLQGRIEAIGTLYIVSYDSAGRMRFKQNKL